MAIFIEVNYLFINSISNIYYSERVMREKSSRDNSVITADIKK